MNRIISLAGRQAFTHCCELPQVCLEKCFPKQFRMPNVWENVCFYNLIMIKIICIGRCYANIRLMLA